MLDLTDARWAALTERGARADGAFVYAVRTTGVYCRPSCGSRAPRRENVVLFASPEEAETAGFRACKRCAPSDALAPGAATVARARAHLDARLAGDPEARVTAGDLAERVGWSRAHLQRQFTRHVGMSPRAYAEAHRAALAKEALRAGETVLGAALAAGYGSGSALYDRAGDIFGMTPGAFRRGGAGLRVRYALFDTALGVALVAATERGVCAVTLGDDGEALVKILRAELYAADLAPGGAALVAWAEPVLRALAGAPGAFPALLAVPLDVRGTAFQRQVWAALRAIPPGETRTYGEVAKSLGKPTAFRAVAQACGANPVAVVVPCHRVVGARGALRGYRWGPERKARLLAMEGRAGPSPAPTLFDAPTP